MDPSYLYWEDYYRELEPQRRQRLLEKNLSSVPDDGANALRKELFARRCIDEKDPGKFVDRMLWQCVNFVEVYNARYLFKGMARKEVTEALRQLGFSEAAACGEAGEEALYREVRNAASRYFKTCKNPEYRRVLFGLMSSGSKDKKRQVCGDVWKMTDGLAAKYGLAEELAVWNRAVKDQYIAEEPEGRELLERLRREM